MNSKTLLQFITYWLLKYLPLFIALGIIGMWTTFIFYAQFPGKGDQNPVFYPFVRLVADHFTELVVGVISLILVPTGIFVWREGLTQLLDSVLSGIIALGLVWSLALGMLSSGNLPELDILSWEENVYRLTLLGGGLDDEKSYRVIQCDASGNWCHDYSTPYQNSVGCDCFDKDAYLIIDPDSQRLMLQLGSTLYEAEPQAAEKD